MRSFFQCIPCFLCFFPKNAPKKDTNIKKHQPTITPTTISREDALERLTDYARQEKVFSELQKLAVLKIIAAFSNDKDIALKVVQIDGRLIEHLAEKFKGDKEVVKTAVQNAPIVFVAATTKLQTDIEFITELVAAQDKRGQDIILWRVSEDIQKTVQENLEKRQQGLKK